MHTLDVEVRRVGCGVLGKLGEETANPWRQVQPAEAALAVPPKG
jgi:hypothetical protein